MRKSGTLLACFALALALLGGATWLEWRQTARMEEAAEWVAHTHQVRASRNRLLSLVMEAEVGQQTYVLTGQRVFLEMFNRAAAELAKVVRTVEDLTQDELQKSNLATLQRLLAERLDFARRTVALRQDEGVVRAAQEVATLRGKELTDQIRAQVALMDARAEFLLEWRSAAARQAVVQTRRWLAVSNGMSVTLFITVFALMLHEGRRRHRTVVALTASEENLAVTLQSIGDAVLATDAAGRITRLNTTAQLLTGWPESEAKGRPVAEVFRIINETTRQPAFLPVADTLAKGTVHGLANHTVLIARDGMERPIADSCAPIRDREGHIIGSVLAFRDVTHEKAAEVALRKSQRELEAAVRTSQLIMAHSLDVICTFDAQGHFIFVSDACEKVWGYRPDELVGRRYLDLVHPDDHPKTNQAAAEIIAGKQLRDFENRYLRKDGSLVPIVWTASWSAADETMFCVARDVSERKSAEVVLHQAHAELSRVNAELAQASRLKDEFLANMSHELRTPLNAILGLSESLLEQVSAPLTPRQIKSVTTISTSGQHLLALINDILDLSKIEAGKLELHAETVIIDDFCQGCLAFVRTQATGKHIRLALDATSGPARFETDPRRLKQILVNLLTNAVKFTPDGGNVGLAVTTPPGEDVVRFTVWDSGIGIAPADQRKLFTAFSQIDSGLNRTQEGTGLGLALVAKLVELQGGSVALESEPGRGSRFTVTLPLLPRSGPAAPPTLAPPATPDRRDYRRALIVEDDPTSGALLTGYLEELGLSSVLHMRGENCIEAVLRERPDIIILDILLPSESGWVVLTRLKEHPQTRAIPVIVISVVDEPQKSRALGAETHFTKPVTRTQLAQFFQRAYAPPLLPAPTCGRVPSSTGPRVLLAEDNEANIQTVGGYLEDQSYAMHYATNGFTAVKLARDLHPALILMDIQMPVMDGLAAMHEIRADAALRHIPIVALTALAMTGDRERCLAAGATEYLSKPVNLKNLTALVRRLTTEPAPVPPTSPP